MKRLWAWVGLLALVLAALGQKAPGLEALLVRVLLKEVELGEEVRLALPTGEVALRGQAEGVVVEGRLLPSWAVEGPYFALEKRPYRGGLVARVEGGRLLLVNVLPLEDYLLGVLPAEMPASFPEEALKAQAVLARTFAVRRLNPLAPYDLCATEACQVYLGLSAETPRHERAVRATEGRVLSYAGQVASALYHADSGGMTAGSEEVFRKALPYLRPRPDPYAKGPKSVWQQAVRPEDPIITAYRDHGHALARGMTSRACMAEMFGKVGGCAKGKGGSMHMFDRPNNLYGGHGIVGAQTPLGTGLAFATKYEDEVVNGGKNRRVTLCFLGDGALNQGAFHEALNLAGLFDIPVIYVVENNGYSMGTAIARAPPISIAKRPRLNAIASSNWSAGMISAAT